MAAIAMTVDFTNVSDHLEHKSGVMADPPSALDSMGRVLTPKQIRARLRRKMASGKYIDQEEIEGLYQKPIDEWDLEELAHGRPRNRQGRFKGPRPKWISIGMLDEISNRYKAAVKTSMNVTTASALEVLQEIMDNSDTDDRGKPVVAASTKLDAAKFLIEHVIGKPTQRVEGEMSVKLQGILGQVMVNPSELATGNYMPGHFPGVTMALAEGPSDDDQDLLPSSEG